MKKITIITVLTLSLIAVIIFACKKPEKQMLLPAVTAPANNNYSDAKMMGSFCMNGVCCNNGMLEFSDSTTLRSVINCLEQINNSWVEPISDKKENKASRHDAYFPAWDIFEAKLQFRSLRSSLEQKEKMMMDNGTWNEQNDPDNFWIMDDAIRTVLNPELEIKIGKSIFKIMNKYLAIEIKDADMNTLMAARQGLNNVRKHANVRFVAINGGAASGNNPCLPLFSFNQAPGSICTERCFTNLTADPGSFQQADDWVEWDYDDGTTSDKWDGVCHDFKNNGNYNVCLTVHDGATNCTKAYCNWVVIDCLSPCTPNFKWTPNWTGLTKIQNASTGKYTDCVWVIDGVTYYGCNGPNIHLVTTTNVCLTISGPNCPSVTVCKDIDPNVPIGGTKECCERRDRDAYQYNYYVTLANGESRMFKAVIWQGNYGFAELSGGFTAGGYYQVRAKTINYVRRKHDWISFVPILNLIIDPDWKRIKAEAIRTQILEGSKIYHVDGKFCQWTCGTEESISDDSGIKYDVSHANAHVSPGFNFGTKENTVHSSHEVYFNGSWYTWQLSLATPEECYKQCVGEIWDLIWHSTP